MSGFLNSEVYAWKAIIGDFATNIPILIASIFKDKVYALVLKSWKENSYCGDLVSYQVHCGSRMNKCVTFMHLIILSL